MKNLHPSLYISFILIIITFVEIYSQDANQLSFDAELAKELNADDYGMKKYVMVFLKSGPNRSQDSITKSKMQKVHMDNIVKMANEGVLVMAGPLVQSIGLIMELPLWYGSTALQKMGAIHQKISKKKI